MVRKEFIMAQENRQGTRAVFGSWLSTKKGITYTKYSHMPTAAKLDIQKEYAQRGKASVREPGQVNRTQEGTETAVS
jgi:hypothetical protein